MFNAIRKKLTILYAVSFFVFLLLFIITLYFVLNKIMENEQLRELETYYLKESHHLFEYKNNDTKELFYDPNRTFFYYIFNKDDKIIHGDEMYKGLYKEMITLYKEEDPSLTSTLSFEFNEEYFLLLKKPINISEQPFGYIVLGCQLLSNITFFKR